MVQNDLAVGLVNEPNPMEEVINLDLNLPLAQPVEEIPAQVIIVPDEFAFDDGAPLLQLGQPQQQNPDLEVHIPQLVHPPVNYLVDEDMLDQLIDLNAPEADQEQLFVNRMQRPNDVTVDPGLADYLARKQPSSLDLYFNQFDSYCPEADRFWKDFLAPSARCDKVFFVPEEWFKFLIFMLCSPSSFAWAADFIKSRVGSFLSTSSRNIPFMLPCSCPLDKDIVCDQIAGVCLEELPIVDDGLLEDVHLLKKGKAVAPVGRTQTRKKKPQDSNEGTTSGGLGKEQ
ncbi:hypothetical protein BS78_05G075000 [Paspalum vaginatum]|nr:hypothetical protein BS78_05G075000 [Paspalum vaginatum]